MPMYTIGIDLGTSAAKLLLVDEKGKIHNTVTKDYPPLDFIRKNFSKDVLHKHLIFLDEEIDIEDAQSGIYVFLGDCSGKICFNGFSVGTIHVRHTSIIDVCSYDMAKTFVSVYEGATAQCHSFDHATHRLYDKHNK